MNNTRKIEARSLNIYYAAKKSINDIFFFFQAEDGIRDRTVTGVQTCALPISIEYVYNEKICYNDNTWYQFDNRWKMCNITDDIIRNFIPLYEIIEKFIQDSKEFRSEERRVGKERRYRRRRKNRKKKK